ncbi:hypothetical protein SEA_ANON_70 [Gordonia phage Anon]|nr:hypothetical protein SEA_ANON_70 [Gordonia phage Anon]
MIDDPNTLSVVFWTAGFAGLMIAWIWCDDDDGIA